jgi:outer membrane protein TolC
LSAQPCAAQSPEKLTLTLHEAEELALQNNPAMATARADLRLAQARLSQASHARYVPRLSLRTVTGPVPRARAGYTQDGVLTSPDTSTGFSDLRPFVDLQLTLVQPLFTFGKLGRLTDAATHGVRAADADILRHRAAVKAEVRKLYWGLVLAQELLVIVEDARADVSQAREKLQQMFDAGSEDITQADMFKLTLFEYDIDKKHREARDGVALGHAALRAVLGLGQSTEFTLATRSLEPLAVDLDSLPTYIDLALRNRPEITAFGAGIDASAALVRAAKGDYMPQFFVAGEVHYNRAADRYDPRNPFVYNPTNFFRPGIVVGLQWNLNMLQTRDNVRLREFEYSKLASQEQSLVSGIQLQVTQSYLKASRAARNVEESRRALRASAAWLRSEMQTLDLGIGRVSDVIDAFRENSTMKAEHLNNIYDLNAALADLSTSVGRNIQVP